MPRPYAELRSLMQRYGDTQETLGEFLGVGTQTVNNRFTNRLPWRMNEMYAIMSRYNVPAKRLHIVFPMMGISNE